MLGERLSLANLGGWRFAVFSWRVGENKRLNNWDSAAQVWLALVRKSARRMSQAAISGRSNAKNSNLLVLICSLPRTSSLRVADEYNCPQTHSAGRVLKNTFRKKNIKIG
jgi:hypothetical protein